MKGYSGCLKLIQKCSEKAMLGSLEACIDGKPRFIISEFWAGRGDVRRELIRRLRKESGYDYIYPGDSGMTFFGSAYIQVWSVWRRTGVKTSVCDADRTGIFAVLQCL